MNTIRLNQDIIPLSEFRASVASSIEHLKKTQRPALLTQHGKGVAVLLDVDEFEVMRERLEILEDVQAAREDITKGRVYSAEEVRERILSGFAS